MADSVQQLGSGAFLGAFEALEEGDVKRAGRLIAEHTDALADFDAATVAEHPV